MHTNPITEKELLVAAQYRAIRKIRIEETSEERYITHITLSKEDEEKTLITQRKHPREWVSLDRLIKHIRNNYGNVQNITLTLYSSETKTNPE